MVSDLNTLFNAIYKRKNETSDEIASWKKTDSVCWDHGGKIEKELVLVKTVQEHVVVDGMP